MGVKDLWKLLEPAGRPVKLESLEGIVLGVDVSIWLNQAVKGVRDRRGEPVPYAHLIVLFNRICKLLHYHIKPVFVFDGATPQLKQKTLASRSKRRDVASQRSLRAADKRASKLLQAKILEHLTGEKSSVNVVASSSGQSDMFHLPPIPEGVLSKDKSPTFEEPLSSVQSANNAYYSDVASVDVHAKEFDSLPPEVQHEILLERQQIEKYSYHDPDTLPQVANDFSNYQLSRLMKRSRISQKLEGVRKVLKSNDTAVVGLGEESKVHEVETSRIVSSEASHYILVKGTDIKSQSSQDEEEEEENDSQSQTNSLDMGIGTGVGSFTDPVPKPEDVESDIGSGGACLTAAREEIEHEVRKFFKERKEGLVAEDENKISRSGLATVEKSTAVARGKDYTVVLESESSGEEELEDVQKVKMGQEKPGIEGVMSQLLARDDMTSDHKEQLPLVTGPSSSISKEMAVTGEESSDSAMATKLNDDVLPMQTTINLTTSAKEEEALEHSRIVRGDITVEEKSEISPSIDLTATLIAQEQLKSLATSPSKQTTSENTEHGLHPTQSSVTEVVALIESDEGDSPSPLTAAVEVESDEGDSPSPRTAGWSGGKEVEALLTVAPSEAQEQLSAEMEELERERTRQSRAAAGVSNQMYKEAQELISLFGLPYLVAPTEAEAQCAALNEQELTQGTITDDNDVFLFGGRKVYRRFFSQDREVELYTSSELQQRLGLSRDHLIVLAYLLGSDYTEGLEGIGIVMAMEVLRDFPGMGLEPLIKLRDWHNQVAHKPIIVSKGSALQKKLCQYPLPAGFPNASVRDSYLHPEIDDSSEQFEWGKPDLDLIRRFTFEKMGWSQEKVDEILLPVLKRINAKQSQRQKKITQFLPSLPSSTSPSLVSPTKQRRAIKSRRIRNVVARLTAEDEEEQVPKPKPGSTKRTRGSTKRQPAAKRQKKSNVEDSPPSLSKVSQPALKGPNLSASSSSSEDEFDSLVKSWNGEISVDTTAIEDAASVRTKGQKRTKRGN